ncbi:transglycosylase domain-containing protein [Actinoplanes couchii]|uniref:Glycosyl transferase family 51 domain-containing protein n=1 Tax=Actinoplanes couchii TaxID=403638 RepID=A0ABQ3XGY6_9ACTN|nr:transglycosylase domain-containing protein [Actinoplanes couchii]MDR6320779.1 membrane peptidoglycan carboxypeptidase [Actinoplanes couchii]GID57736.1 hypothetical protein Aco03nite_061400 [Actinoplanes couchii]
MINAPVAPPARRRRLLVGVSAALLLAAGGVVGATTYFDSVPLAEDTVAYPAVPDPVATVFVAAVDPDFYESSDSLITRRYVEILSGEPSGLRTRVMARKAESEYSKAEILARYLGRADFGDGTAGLEAAAQARFQKPAGQLTVAEAAVLAVALHPDRPSERAGWEQVLDTMVENGWLTAADRNGLFFPG